MMKWFVAAVVALLLLGAVPAGAIDFNQPISDIEGVPIPGDKGEETFTVRKAVVNALLAPYQDEANLPGDEKVRRFQLAMRIHAAKGDLPVSAEDVALIKKLVAKAYSPLIVGRIWEIIDPAVTKK